MPIVYELSPCLLYCENRAAKHWVPLRKGKVGEGGRECRCGIEKVLSSLVPCYCQPVPQEKPFP